MCSEWASVVFASFGSAGQVDPAGVHELGSCHFFELPLSPHLTSRTSVMLGALSQLPPSRITSQSKARTPTFIDFYCRSGLKAALGQRSCSFPWALTHWKTSASCVQHARLYKHEPRKLAQRPFSWFRLQLVLPITARLQGRADGECSHTRAQRGSVCRAGG